ncbi:polyisoprenyl-teichoic acid--peptidoglycan teichoic acid transferase TagU [Mesobacillus foraminis]|uniref:polyisoprenyl-teichoic acid--peptidoglycan teichoic acid transferase TagU n=1 Tax=Mesobacillus foraminis TaxID=279826 RepID=UPI000EF469C2|nr:LytR family transcriptional regulator [Mesobacillus foraminis]
MSSRLDTNVRTPKKKKRKWVKVLITALLLLVLAVGAYAFTIYRSLNKAVETMHEPINREKSEKRTEDLSLKTAEPFSVLLLGVDQRENDRGRSDSMIVMTVNQEDVKMISIPRDTRTEIIGRGTQDKINHAYAFGGVEMSMNTVENFLDIPIDYYVQINMEGFKDIVDAVGGVTVQNTLDFTYSGEHFPEGELMLNGERALVYSQMRKQDPRGDFGRQSRQRQIIQGVIKEGASLNTLTNFGDIFSALGNNVKTNLTFDEMVTIQSKYKAAGKAIEQLELKGSGTTINDIYYYQVPEEEKTRVQTVFKDHLAK